MPMSQAAMDGISANGHRWKSRINGLKPHTEVLGKANDANNDGEPYDHDATEKAVQDIIKIVRSFADKLPDESSLKQDLLHDADDLEMVEDCDIEDINHEMNDLYDSFDFHRVLVAS
jgi:hypothetical protein